MTWKWKPGMKAPSAANKFTYDGLDRMLNATYQQHDLEVETAGIWTAPMANANRFSENVTGYDKTVTSRDCSVTGNSLQPPTA